MQRIVLGPGRVGERLHWPAQEPRSPERRLADVAEAVGAAGDVHAEDEIAEVAAVVEGEPQSVALNSRLLVDLLDTVDGPQLELAWSSPQSPVVIREVGRRSSTDLALAMPLHLPALVRREAEAA